MSRDLTALVSSRICHDLISPIGAISNGVELMTELGGGATPELGLIADSVDSAAGKVRFFRIAFGAAQTRAEVAVEELRQVIGAMFNGRNQAMLQADQTNLPRQTAKLLLLALLCVEKTLPLGGRITAHAGADGFRIDITAERFNPIPEKWALLRGGPDEGVTAADVQFLLLRDELAGGGTILEHQFGDGSASLSVSGLRPAT
ncbi:histidine phosphotransferase family protein [Halovulum sp. GXIMD14793]